MYPYRFFNVHHYERIDPLLSLKMKSGKILYDLPDLKSIQQTMKNNLKHLDDTFKRIINPHVYKISLSRSLKELKFRMIEEYGMGKEHLWWYRGF